MAGQLQLRPPRFNCRRRAAFAINKAKEAASGGGLCNLVVVSMVASKSTIDSPILHNEKGWLASMVDQHADHGACDRRAETAMGTPTRPQTPPVARGARV